MRESKKSEGGGAFKAPPDRIELRFRGSLAFNKFNFNYVYFRHKKSIYYKIYMQLVKINIMIYNNAIRSISTKTSVVLKKTYLLCYNVVPPIPNSGEIRTEESQIDTSRELSERINLFVMQNTCFLSNSPNDLILSCTNISLALLYFGMPCNNLRRLLYMQFLIFL